MSKWRNILCEGQSPDGDMLRIDELERNLGELPPEVERVRALISRFDSVVHYKAFDNLSLLLNAIGRKTYPGSPAVDVLTRAWEIDEQRHADFKAYVLALTCWSEGLDAADAEATHPDATDKVHEVYKTLGERDEQKAWLAASLAKTLKAFTFTPEDDIDSFGDEEFICGVYEAALGRQPSSDDLKFRVVELRAGKTRPDFIREIFDANESQQRRMQEVIHHVKRSRGAE